MTESIHDPHEKRSHEPKHPKEPASSPPQPSAAEADAPPWELVGKGRYRPRRIRGSYRGRELG